jgi:LysR family transcriptional regulator, glycine cleavage system transcriptional activator
MIFRKSHKDIESKRMNHLPLAALRVFECAARRRSFALAGEELHLTAGAISHQVKLVEAWVGRPLFTRRPNGVALTESGQIYAMQLKTIFDRMVQVSEDARSPGERRRIIVRCQMTVSSKWLMSRVLAFRRLHPDVELIIRSEGYHPDPLVGGADAAIYYSRGPITGLRQDPIVGGRYIIVASPDCLSDVPHRPKVRDFLDLSLIHFRPLDRGWSELDWQGWFRKAGVETANELRGLSFSLMQDVIDACVAGGGFALINDVMAAGHLEARELQQAISWTEAVPHRFHLIVAETNLKRPEIQCFREFLLAQATI